jgi:predicted enzyme related to lactoylglutathione lyase
VQSPPKRTPLQPTSTSANPEESTVITGIAFTGSAVTDMKRARAFYEDVLGLGPSEEMAGGKWVEYQVGGATFALTSINPKWTPSDQGTAIAFEVDDLDAMVERVKRAGGTFFMEPMESPVCWLAIAQDPDGNKVVLHKIKPA